MRKDTFELKILLACVGLMALLLIGASKVVARNNFSTTDPIPVVIGESIVYSTNDYEVVFPFEIDCLEGDISAFFLYRQRVVIVTPHGGSPATMVNGFTNSTLPIGQSLLVTNIYECEGFQLLEVGDCGRCTWIAIPISTEN